ncbi:Leucine--tRNA ligase, cytoplasmic [Paramyrothecium foliicola]|nr:Leucine--tRNA ligase, cytoplasmic [Paramyrothecium foliicola]
MSPPVEAAASAITEADKRKVALLQRDEQRWQKQWSSKGIFERGGHKTQIQDRDTGASSTEKGRGDKQEKFFGTVPLLPVDGRLHMGHAQSVLQVDFATGFAMMNGKRAVFPVGFTCSGSSIQDRSSHIKKEMDRRRLAEWIDFRSTDEPPANFQQRYPEMSILHSQGIPASELELFMTPAGWMGSLPALAKRDLETLGIRVDWRRSFVTGDCNPFYSSFVRWQVNRLRHLGKLQYGKAHTLYCPEASEPCPMVQDENGGRIQIAAYTAVKMKVLGFSPAALKHMQEAIKPEAKVYAVCILSKPEYLDGVGCCWISPNTSYGIFRQGRDEYLLVSHNSAANMAYQDFFSSWGKCECVATVSGSELVGTSVEVPVADIHRPVHLLSDDNFVSKSATGIHAAFPSEDIEDYLKLMLLRQTSSLRQVEEWMSYLPPIVVQKPPNSAQSAHQLYKDIEYYGPVDVLLGAKRTKDLWELAASEAYFHGHMLVGRYQGLPVREARRLIRTSLLSSGCGIEYLEPSTSTAGDSRQRYVVAHMDHWHLNFRPTEDGVKSWLSETLSLLNDGRLKYMSAEAKSNLQASLHRLGSWAAGKQRGHGTRAPWNESLVIDPVVESAIAPAYQTVAHMLHSDMYGELLGKGAIVRPEQMTDEVWDYIFDRLRVGSKELDKLNTTLHYFDLSRLRQEFASWYPVDLFVADGSRIDDQVPSFLHHHVALWPPKYWPRGAVISGQLVTNGQRPGARQKNDAPIGRMTSIYGADAVRMAVARLCNSQTVGDVEWDEAVVLESLRQLYELKMWIETTARADDTRSNDVLHALELHDNRHVAIWDVIFMDELDRIMRAAFLCYKRHDFNKALQHALDDTVAALDRWRTMTRDAKDKLHRMVFAGYVRMQVLVLGPICPHWCEGIWKGVLKEGDTIHTASFPKPVSSFSKHAAAAKLLNGTIAGIRQEIERVNSQVCSGVSADFDPASNFSVIISFGCEYAEWQLDCIGKVGKILKPDEAHVDTAALVKGLNKEEAFRYTVFAQHLQSLLEGGMNREVVLAAQYPCDQGVVLQAAGLMLANTVPNCCGVEVTPAVDDEVSGRGQRATPGFPVWQLQNVP